MTTHIRSITYSPIPSGPSTTTSREMKVSLSREPWHIEAKEPETRKAPEPQFVSVIGPRVAQPRSGPDTYGDAFDRMDECWLAKQMLRTMKREVPKYTISHGAYVLKLADTLAAHLSKHEDGREGMAQTFKVSIKTIDRALSVLRERGVLTRRMEPTAKFCVYRVIK